MFGNTAVSVRLKKECADFISEFFTSKQEFMRKAIESYCELPMVRVLHPQGGACINFYQGGYGIVQYYWNYYKGQQFIVVTNESGFEFQRYPKEYRAKIYEQLKIQENESIEFYISSNGGMMTSESREYSKFIWHTDKFNCWDFEVDGYGKGSMNKSALSEMIELMNMHNSHYILNRKAFVYERLYSATSEWEDEPSLHCSRIIGV